MKMLVDRVDAVIDVHSGTAVRTTEYIYDYGNLELSASFAYLPVMVNRAIPGQLCTAAKAAGLDAALVEFGGPDRNSTRKAVEGCLNMLRYRGHLADAATGPDDVAILSSVQAIVASRDGILESAVGPQDVGNPIRTGVIGYLTGAVSGARLEDYVVEKPLDANTRTASDDAPILMLAQTTPSLVRPGPSSFHDRLAIRAHPHPAPRIAQALTSRMCDVENRT